MTVLHESLSNNTMRSTCARPPREMPKSLKKQMVFQEFQHRTSAKHMKTHYFLIGARLKNLLARTCWNLKNQWFFNIPVKGAFAGNFRARVELLQRHSRACQGRHPCQIIPCGPHARGRRARCRNPKKNNSFSIISTSEFNKTYENTILSHRRTSDKSARAHLLKP